MGTEIKTGRCLIFCGILLTFAWISCGGSDSATADRPSGNGASLPNDPRAVAALGRIEPTNGFIEIATGTPDRVSSIRADEGDWVEAGAVLLVLESHAERQRAVDLARTTLEEERRRHVRELELARAKLKEAEAGLDQARRLLPLDVKACQAEVERLRIQLADARTNLHRFDTLADRNSVSESEKQQYETAFKEAEKSLEAATTRLEEARVKQEVELVQAQRRVDTARASLERVVDSDNLEGLQKQLALTETQLEQTIIRAPTAGEILKIFARPGEAASGSPMILLGDTKRLCVVAEVYETDVGLVSKGQRARVTSRALSGELGGSVQSVGHLILRNQLRDLDPAARVDRRVVEVRILLDDPEAARRFLNLQVDVEIFTGSGTAEET